MVMMKLKVGFTLEVLKVLVRFCISLCMHLRTTINETMDFISTLP